MLKASFVKFVQLPLFFGEGVGDEVPPSLIFVLVLFFLHLLLLCQDGEQLAYFLSFTEFLQLLEAHLQIEQGS
jgi:hypothetical protein